MLVSIYEYPVQEVTHDLFALLYGTQQAALREVQVLSRRNYTLKVSMTWEQAADVAAVVASMEFQV